MMISYKTNESNFRIRNRGVINVFYLFQVNKLNLIKHRNSRFNIILMFSAMICFSIAIFISEVFDPVKIFSILCCVLFFIVSITYREYEYELAITLKDNRSVKIIVDTMEVDEVKQQVIQINKVLRKENENYAFARNEMSEESTLKQKSIR